MEVRRSSRLSRSRHVQQGVQRVDIRSRDSRHSRPASRASRASRAEEDEIEDLPRRAPALRHRRSREDREVDEEVGIWNSESDPEIRHSDDDDDAPLVPARQRPAARAPARAQAAQAARARPTSTAKPKPGKGRAAKAAKAPAKTAKNRRVSTVSTPEPELEKVEKPKVVNDWGPWLPSNRSACWKELSKALLPGRPKRKLEVPVPKSKAKESKAKAKPKAKAKAAAESRDYDEDAEMEELFGDALPTDAPATQVSPSAKSRAKAKAVEAVEVVEAVEAGEDGDHSDQPEGEEQSKDAPQVGATPAVIQAEHPSKNVLVCGDLNGEITLLQKALQDLKESGTDIAVVFAVGRFLPPETTSEDEFRRQCQETELAAPVYFIDSTAEDLIDSAQKTSDCISFGPNIFFLGAYGIREVEGLTVAFLSGKYTEKSYRKISEHFFLEPGSGEGYLYTENTAKEMKLQAEELNIDVLLTCEWPDTFWSTAKKAEAINPVDARFRSPAVRELFFQLKPRYHVYASANFFRLRKAQQGPHGFVCTSVALCEAFAESDAEGDANHRWFHHMSMRHNCPEKYSLLSEAARVKVKSQTKLSHL